MESFDKIISLGNTCVPAEQIRCKYFKDKTSVQFYDSKLFLSNEYPHGSFLFDWLQCPVQSLIKVLESDFEGIFELDDMQIGKRIGSKRCVARNHKYGINFPHLATGGRPKITRHTFKWKQSRIQAWTEFESIYENRKAKYDYLTKKTRDLFYSKMDILFVVHKDKVYSDPSIDIYTKLYDILKKFPCKSKLLVTSQDPKIVQGEGKFDNIFFRSVEQHGIWEPEADSKSWLSAMRNFQFRD
jgi:hypothetical protein